LHLGACGNDINDATDGEGRKISKLLNESIAFCCSASPCLSSSNALSSKIMLQVETSMVAGDVLDLSFG